MTPAQIAKIRQAHDLLGSLLAESDDGQTEPKAQQPLWRTEEEKRWRLMKAVELAGGDLGGIAWTTLGAEHGYKPQGLGGFYRGSTPCMAVQGERRVLTDYGRRFVERWEADFGPYET